MSKSLIDFEHQQPFAVRFFNDALSTGRLATTFLLRGTDLATMYRLILRLGQILNCEDKTSSPTQACGQCTSCKWIEANRHPGVTTVSTLTSLETVDPETGKSKPEKGTPKKQITVKQLSNLLNELGLQSQGFKRIVVLCGADELPLEEGASMPFPPPSDWRAPVGKQLELLPLDMRLFPAGIANKFLKTLEEPPQNVLFFLLTDREDKLLETIVSRCQTVPFATPLGVNRIDVPTAMQGEFERLLGLLEQQRWMEAHAMLTTLAETSGNTLVQLLEQLEAFVWGIRDISVTQNQFRLMQYRLKAVEKAKRMLKDKVRTDAVLDQLALHWTP